MTPDEILDKVWTFLNCKVKKPEIILRKQHGTGLYWPKEHKISIREDSWNKMMPAEKKLVVIHEAIHACKIPHQPGFRTSIDNVSKLAYKELYGNDKDLVDFDNHSIEKLNKIRRGEDKKIPYTCEEGSLPEEPCDGTITTIIHH